MYILGVLQMLVNKDLSFVYEDLSQIYSPLNGAKCLYAFPTESLSGIQFVESLCLTWPSGRLFSLCSFFLSWSPVSFLPCKGRFLQSYIERGSHFYSSDWGIYQDSHLADISHVSQYNSNALFYQNLPMVWVRRSWKEGLKEGGTSLPTVSAPSLPDKSQTASIETRLHSRL